MIFETYHPKSMLKNFVDSIVFLGGYFMGNGIAFQRMHQVIIINMGDPFSTLDVYNDNIEKRVEKSTIWINGKQEIPFVLENKGLTAMYAIGLKTGMLPFFTNLPAIESNEQTVAAEHWTSKEIYFLREQLEACADVQTGFQLIEQYLLDHLLARDWHNLDKIHWLGNAIHHKTVGEICTTLNITRKKLRSEAQHYLGDSIKNIQGILRFNHTLQAIAKQGDRNLSAIHPYYDQSHFINDFKARCGITPFQYKKLVQHFPAIKTTPNFLPMERETFLQFISGATG